MVLSMIGLGTRSGRPHRTPPFSLVSKVKRGRKGHRKTSTALKNEVFNLTRPAQLMFMLHVSSMSSFGQNIAFCHLPIPSPSIILPFGKYNSCPWHQSKCPHHLGSKKFNSKDMSFFFGVCYHLSNNMKS